MIAIILDIKCCGSCASRLLVDDSSRQHSNGVRFILPRAHSRITTTERALANQARRLFTIIDSMLLPVVCHVSCGLRQRHYRIIRCTCAGFTKATCPLLPTKESTIFEQNLRARTTINHNALIGRCPLLITPGQCARFCYRELEYPADFRLLRRHQETIFVCIYLCGQFLKSPQSRSRKLSEIQSTPQNNLCQHL